MQDLKIMCRRMDVLTDEIAGFCRAREDLRHQIMDHPDYVAQGFNPLQDLANVVALRIGDTEHKYIEPPVLPDERLDSDETCFWTNAEAVAILVRGFLSYGQRVTP